MVMLLSDPPQDLSDNAWAAAAVGILMAIWWATEALNIAVTALLPIVLFPMLDIATIGRFEKKGTGEKFLVAQHG